MRTDTISDLRIGIPIIGIKDWLGGISYVEHLVKALKTLPESNSPKLFLVVSDWYLESYGLHQAIIPLFNGIFFVGQNLSRASSLIRQPFTHLRSHEELSDHIDFYYPVNSYVIPDLCSGSWIPDFQHIHLPEFFSPAECQRRDNLYREIAEQAKLVVFSSKDAEKDFRNLFPSSPAVTRVLHFHALPADEWFAPDPIGTQHKYNLPDEFLICCNQFWAHKNHICIFEALAKMRQAGFEVHLVCTGSAAEWRFPDFFPKLLKRIEELGVKDLVHILGTIPRLDQIQLIRRSLAVIQPSLFEGWSTVVEDSRVLGKTMILSDLAVHYEQAPAHSVYFDRHNPEDLSQIIVQLLSTLRPGAELSHERDARIISVKLVHDFAGQFCNIAVEAQEIFNRRKIVRHPQNSPKASLTLRDMPNNQSFNINKNSYSLPKISIVTPSFNQGQFLEECIDSILSQNYPNLEYIIMDGGSTDNSVEIIKKYEKHLTYWQSRPDDGHYAAVSEGFKRTTGEIMGWLNSDDKFHHHGLFVLGEVFSRFPHVRFLTGKRIGFDGAGNIRSFGFEQQTWNRSMLLDINTLRRQLFIMQEATYWRRELWEKAGAALDLSYKFAADLALWLRFTRFTQLYTVDALIAGFRYHGPQQRSQIFLKEYLAECEKTLTRESKLKSANPHLDGVSPALIAYPVDKRVEISVKKERPKISIVTPSFNQGQFLEKCIDSILSQNYPNLEYIIMDGGSTDNSLDIIKKYEKYLTYWQSKPDNGQYDAINEGFKKTTGEIMTWINSDDILHPKSLEIVANIFSHFGNVEWIMGWPNGIDEQGKQSWILDILPIWSREKYLTGQYRNPYIQQEGTFWRRTLWERAGGDLDTRWKLAGDMELWARFFHYAQLYSVDALLGAFRRHSAQKTATFHEEYNREAERIIDREIQFYNESSDKTLLPAPPQITGEQLSALTDQTVTVSASSKTDDKALIKVSAIVSIYNAERFMRGCLEDLVNQTIYKKDKLEIVIVDSGSQQDEKAIVEEFMQRYKNIVYIRTKEREGVYAAWNRGIKAARGEYITNANTDDRHRSDALEVMAFMLNRRPDIGLVYADVLITNKENETYEKHTRIGAYRWEEFRREFLACHNYMGPQPMWRKSFHDTYGYFDESFTVSGDWEFWLRIADNTQFLHIPEFLGLYLASTGSIEHKNIGHREKEDRRIHRIYIPKYFPKFEEHYAAILKNDPVNSNAVYWLGKILTSLERYDKAISLYSSYLEKNPDDTQIAGMLEEVKILSGPTPSVPESGTHGSIRHEGEQKEIKVSAIVSTYNSERFIRGCLEDLVNQTLYQKGELEIIVVDSGSQQNEESVVKEFEAIYPGINYIKTEENETVYAAWNRGIKASKGKYITNANTDDRHRKDALEVMCNVLENSHGIGLVYADVIITETENETFEKHTPVGYYRWLDYDREKLSMGCFIGPQPMWRKSLHDRYGYFAETFSSSGDWEFWLRIAEDTKFLHMPEFLGLYLRSPHSLEHQNAGKRIKEDRIVYKTYIPKYLPAYEEHFAGITITDSDPVHVYRYGQILAAFEKYEKAISLYTSFLQKNPAYEGFNFLLADLKSLQAQHSSTQTPPAAPLPEEVMAYVNQADRHIANNDLASAREAIKQALRHASGHTQLCDMLSNMLANLGDTESTRRFLGANETNK